MSRYDFIDYYLGLDIIVGGLRVCGLPWICKHTRSRFLFLAMVLMPLHTFPPV